MTGYSPSDASKTRNFSSRSRWHCWHQRDYQDFLRFIQQRDTCASASSISLTSVANRGFDGVNPGPVFLAFATGKNFPVDDKPTIRCFGQQSFVRQLAFQGVRVKTDTNNCLELIGRQVIPATPLNFARYPGTASSLSRPNRGRLRSKFMNCAWLSLRCLASFDRKVAIKDPHQSSLSARRSPSNWHDNSAFDRALRDQGKMP